MRFVFCILLVALLPGSAWAATAVMSLSQARIAAAKGNAGAAAALATTTDRRTCLNECGNRGYSKARCASACRPGFCHPTAGPPYCIAVERR